jgi:Ca2+-binding RTX toxin-like protein
MNDFTGRVNAGDETLGAIDYTQIQTRFDDVVFPYFSAFLADDPATDYNGPQTRRLNGPRTANVCLQDRFVANTDDHLSITFSDQALTVIREALDRDGPARVVRPDSVCAKLGGDPGGGGSNGRPACTITGTSGNDVLVGTSRSDVICAGGGNDVVRGAGGDDTVYGGSGNDTVRGDAVSDRLFGESGGDAVNSSDGVRGNDSVNGGADRDACNGDFGDGAASCP